MRQRAIRWRQRRKCCRYCGFAKGVEVIELSAERVSYQADPSERDLPTRCNAIVVCKIQQASRV